MQLLESKDEDINKKESNLGDNAISRETVNVILNNPEHFKKLQEKINIAFSESERQNDDVVSKANKSMMRQIMISILKAEEQNDDLINKLMYFVTNKTDKTNKEMMDQAHGLDIL